VDFDTEVKTAIYRWIADTTRAPEAGEIATVLAAPAVAVEEAFRRLFAKRVLFSSRTAARSGWRRPSQAFRPSTASASGS
jgi:hypothetical protein